MEWAGKTQTFVLENDYDSEYSYGAPYLPSMQGMDTNDLVIYRYTFWRALYPLVRMSILVLPRRLAPIVQRAQQFLGEAPLLEQKALSEFIKEGHLERHIKRTRSIYEARRVALIQSLTQHFKRLPISTAGMHLLVTFPPEYSAEAIMLCGMESGLAIADTTEYYYSMPAARNEFMLGFAYYSDTNLIHAAVSEFARRLGQYT
jgi:GntR family transcriptional regulator/MocR family aminotransferase